MVATTALSLTVCVELQVWVFRLWGEVGEGAEEVAGARWRGGGGGGRRTLLGSGKHRVQMMPNGSSLNDATRV